jgi:LmbE family N-acetylglucosaminyl deacetylase
MMKYFIVAFLVSTVTFAQKNLLDDLKRIKSTGTVLHVAAHPDDESTHVLTWFAQQQHWETNYFSCTRGDGGQNLIGDDQGIPLGLIRTQELLAARKIDGANQYFSQAFDFGFSKSTTEALSFWNKELVLSNLVLVIRKMRPDIIFTRFPPDSRAGHGHHSASSVLTIEAFKAAADPRRFPEQLVNGLTPWQAKRLLWNTFRFPGSANSTIAPDQFKVEIGDFLPSIGQSTGEMAAYSRSQHKSQGFGFAVDHGKQTEYFTTLGGETPQIHLWDGVENHWQEIGESLEKQIDQIISEFNAENPSASIPALVNFRKSLSKSSNTFWQTKKIKQIDAWIVQAAGIHFASTTNQGTIARGDTLQIKSEFILRSKLPIFDVKLSLAGKDTTFSGAVNAYQKLQWLRKIPVNQSITQPYWLADAKSVGHYQVKDTQKIGQADADPALSIQASFLVGDQRITVSRPVQELVVDPVKGELSQPLTVTPRSIFSINHQVLLIPVGSNTTKSANITLQAMGRIGKGRITIQTKEGKSLGTLALEKGLKKGEKRDIVISFKASDFPKTGKFNLEIQLAYQTSSGNWIDSLQMETISYPHIPIQRYFSPVQLSVLHIEFKKTGQRIAYIKGAGDKVPEALEQMGYQVDFLTETDLKLANLKRYDAVITGIRAYNTLDYLENSYPELMKYVEQGGNYVVQYNTASYIGPMKSSMAPYPLTINRNRITHEDAKPVFLLPTHKLFQVPNKITETDFENWVQERSIYHAESTDSRYEFPLGFSDPNENQQAGAVAVTKFGKGQFIYTGLVFFRELPAGVPGAWRLMANFLSNQ